MAEERPRCVDCDRPLFFSMSLQQWVASTAVDPLICGATNKPHRES